jgi:hypothetical protein
MARKQRNGPKARVNKAIFALARSAPYRERDEFWRWLRPRLGAVDYDTLIALDTAWVASQNAAELYAEWVVDGRPHRGSI